MAASSLVLFALHNTLEPQGFENLCVDLLIREGHSRIIPGGKTRDHGRDAEVRYWIEPNLGSPKTAFQFSKESDWEKKLRQDVAKIVKHCDSISQIVFVSSRSVTVEKQDKLRKEFSDGYQISLQILDEGWFRVRLEEDHIDLAAKHLGVNLPPTPGFYATQIRIHGLTDENHREILGHRSPEEMRAVFTARTKADPDHPGAWKGLADVCYFLSDYESALVAASRALKLTRNEAERWNLTALKASIIAEQGIATGSRQLLTQAKDLFEPFIERLGRSVDHYNMGNILGALDELEEAEFHYRRCLEIDPEEAKAWHNLGTLLVKLRRRDEGISCIDKSLELNPELLPAICTRASVSVMSSNGSAEAIRLMERAFAIDPDVELRWEHAHYWYSLALCQEERFQEALEIVEDRLERKMDCRHLGRLASDIYSKLWRSDPEYIPRAERFFASRIDSRERNYRAIWEYLDIMASTNREDEAWLGLIRFIGIEDLPVRDFARRIPLKISDLAETFASEGFYSHFRSKAGFSDYALILNESGLRPHDEVPEILYHFFMVPYYKLASAFEDSKPNIEEKIPESVVIETYRLVSRIFSSFGGSLLSPVAPSNREEQLNLIARAILPGHDIPLMEISRLLGFLSGKAANPIPDTTAIADAAREVQLDWLTEFLKNTGYDWGIDGLSQE
jgi:tetratricopeptide (TPR) repeat protein